MLQLSRTDVDHRIAKFSEHCTITRNKTIQDISDEMQGFTLPVIYKHVPKEHWYYVQMLLFLLPVVYTTVSTLESESNLPSTVYFDYCNATDPKTGASYPGIAVPNQECALCNRESSAITATSKGFGFTMYVVAAAMILCQLLNLALLAKVSLGCKRSLDLLSYGVYTVPPLPTKGKKFIAGLLVPLVLQVFLQVVFNAVLQSGKHDGALNSGEPCFFQNANYTMVAGFNEQVNASFKALSPKKTALQWVVSLIAIVVVFGACTKVIFNMYLKPYSNLGLHEFGSSRAVTMSMAEHLRFNVEYNDLDAAIAMYWRCYPEVHSEMKFTFFESHVLGKKTINATPPVEYFVCRWGDDATHVSAVLALCDSLRERAQPDANNLLKYESLVL